MKNKIWEPSTEQVKRANMTLFMKFVNEKQNLTLSSYEELYKWSITNIPKFWAALWDFTGIKASKTYDRVVNNIEDFFKVEWFPGAELNFAENLLKYRDDKIAFIFRGEQKKSKKITYSDLYKQVARLAKALREIGVTKGDRVAAYMPNLIETVVAMLAATSIGALWASCGAELGSRAVIDRFAQIKPKVLFTTNGYYYKGKTFSTQNNVKEVINALPMVKKAIVTYYTDDTEEITNTERFESFLWQGNKEPDLIFEQLSFNHPGYIMFTSGTTGKPKCMVQRTGGVLLNQLRDTVLHTDLKREDRITYITSPSWMMWNWLVGCLAVGSTILLYDGNPLYPDWGTMWKIIQEEQLTIFGCSASYLHHLMGLDVSPGKEYDLTSLRAISQTASPISSEAIEWMYEEIKSDFHFNSITGGSDINAIFAGGVPILPLYVGELQARALGMTVEAYNEQGNPVRDQQAELVCEDPSPSMPLYFWNDMDNKKYKKAYFEYFMPTGKMVWRHGDYIIIHSDTGGMTVFGRSDAVLKPSGVRIGTSEIYDIIEPFEEVSDSVAIGQKWKGDQRIILFIKMAEGFILTDDIKAKIKSSLREKASPRHVPAMIIETPDIPYTFSGKKVEIAVSKIIHNEPIANKGALANPESLDFYENIRRKLTAK